MRPTLAGQSVVTLHGCIHAGTCPCCDAPQGGARICLCWFNAHATHHIAIVASNLHHLIVVHHTAWPGLLKDGPFALSLELGVGEALLLEGGGYHFVISHGCHHVQYCTGIKLTVQLFLVHHCCMEPLHLHSHMTPASAPPALSMCHLHTDPLHEQPMHDQWQ